MGESKLEPLIAKVKENWQRKMLALKDDLFNDLDEMRDMEMAPPPPSEDARTESLLDAFTAFRSCFAQVELLTTLLDSAQKFVPRVILFILKERKTHGWSGRGFGAPFLDTKLKKVRWSIESFPELLRAVKDKQGFCANFSDLGAISDEIKGFEGFIPLKACFYPILVRGKVAAVLYADSGSESTFEGARAVELLAYLAGLELTMITMKLKKQTDAKSAEAAPAKPAPEPEKAPDKPAPAKADSPSGFAELEAVARGKGEKPSAQPAQTPPAQAPPAEAKAEVKEDESAIEIEKAKRVARVLVSDIMLYHESEVAKGQTEGNLYELLKADIDRSYQHYVERVGDSAPEMANFFKEELIRQLADGNPDLMGELPF